jgi:hypothetical protein
MLELANKLQSSVVGPVQGHVQMKLIHSETQFLVVFSDNTVLGEVNAQLEQALLGIVEQQYQLDFEVFAPIKSIQEIIGRAVKEKDAIVRVQINLYGPHSIADNIGKELSQHKIYLQRPGYMRGGATYENPHVLSLPGFESWTSGVVVPQTEEHVSEKATTETLKNTIADVYSYLTRDQNLRGLEGDERLTTSLLL